MNDPMSVYELGFALDDVILFLDTHPDCAEALEYYRALKVRYAHAMEEYTETCAPLAVSDVPCNDGWSWAQTPWPWEGGCLCGAMKSGCSTR